MKKTISIKFVAALLIAISLLPGCASKKDKLTFHDVVLKEGEILPDKDQLKQERAKIVVLETENRIVHSKDTQSGEAFALAIEKELNESATEVVDRKIASLLSNELKLAELNGTGSYSGPQVAQYAVRGQINSAEYAVTKSAQLISKLFRNKNDIPVRYDHKVKVGGTIKVYELPSLRMLTAINVTGTASESDSETGENDVTRAALLKTAIEYAISDQSHELKNYFAPKGYVAEGRANALQSMFKVLMGRGQGVKFGHYVAFYSPRKKQAEVMTGKAPVEEIQVAQGWIADNVSEDVSWVVVDDKEAAGRVRLGDYVKVRYEANSLLSRMVR
jgi:hypothetical protein